MAIALPKEDRAKVRYFLGYPNVEPVTTISLGFPSQSQSSFLVEAAMDRITPESVPIVNKCLRELDDVEEQISSARKRYKAQQLGELKLRGTNDERTEGDLLRREFDYWADRLASVLGVPRNPFTNSAESGAPLNVPIVFRG